MTDSRGQVSTMAVAAVAASVVLSLLVGGGVLYTGATDDFNLNSTNNDEVPTGPAISFAAVCVAESDISASDVSITFSNPKPGESGEYLNASFTSSVPIDYVIVFGGGVWEKFYVYGATSGEVTFGEGTDITDQRDNGDQSAPCDGVDDGVKQNVGGDEEEVSGVETRNGPNGPNGDSGPLLPVDL